MAHDQLSPGCHNLHEHSLILGIVEDILSLSVFDLQPKDEPNYDTRSRWHNIVPGMRQVRFFPVKFHAT